MNIQVEKLDLIQWLSQLSDVEIITKIKVLRDERANDDGAISKEEQAEIAEGIKDIEDGQFFTHEEVMANVDNRFRNLLK